MDPVIAAAQRFSEIFSVSFLCCVAAAKSS